MQKEEANRIGLEFHMINLIERELNFDFEDENGFPTLHRILPHELIERIAAIDKEVSRIVLNIKQNRSKGNEKGI